MNEYDVYISGSQQIRLYMHSLKSYQTPNKSGSGIVTPCSGLN
ncbi:5716_t:CDS:2 [Entrophospora sp. SA101]|nr:5716_t:CDS:2 [Entrophospora sp. SA101]